MVTELVVGMANWLVGNANRLLISIGVLAGLIVAKQFVNRWRRDREVSSRLALLISGIVALLIGSGLFTIVAVWELNEPLYNAYAGLDLSRQVANVVLSFAILGGGYALADFVGHVIKDLAREQEAISEHEREILHRLTQVTIYVFALLVVVGLFTDNIGSLLVGAGFLGIVVGMAARQTLGAVLAGFVIMFSKPFEVGDWVIISENEGMVTDITIANTRILSFDGEYVMIPNDIVTSTSVINRTRRGRLRIEVDVGVDFRTDPDRAATVATEAISELDRILDTPNPQVVGKEFGESSIVLGVRGWIDNPSARRRWAARTEMMAAIKQAFADHDIKIPFPQRELSGRAETGGFRLADNEASTEVDPSRDGTSSPTGDGTSSPTGDGKSSPTSDGQSTRTGQTEPSETGDND